MVQKWMEHWNFHEILSKNGPKMDGNGGLGGSWSLWGAPGEALEPKMAPKSAKRRLKRGLDGHLDAFMGQLGSKMGSEIYGKLIKNRCKNRLVFWVFFWCGFGRVWEQKAWDRSATSRMLRYEPGPIRSDWINEKMWNISFNHFRGLETSGYARKKSFGK